MIQYNESTYFSVLRKWDKFFDSDFSLFCDAKMAGDGYLTYNEEIFQEWLERVSDFEPESEMLYDAVERLFGKDAVEFLKELN
jgi:hypothetical protein